MKARTALWPMFTRPVPGPRWTRQHDAFAELLLTLIETSGDDLAAREDLCNRIERLLKLRAPA